MSDPLKEADFLAETREPDRNDRLIPMINVVFLLLTFFIVSGTFRAAEILDVEPPEVSAANNDFRNDAPTVLVARDGAIAIGDRRLSAEEAIALLKETVGEKPVEIRVKADRGAQVGVVLPLLKKMTDAGLTHIQLLTVRR